MAAVLALLLVSYVFGTSDTGKDDQVAAGPGTDAAARCSSRETSELLKWELFGRAMALRGRDQAAMTQAASHAVVRIAPAGLAATGEASGTVKCSATLVLDLPPNVAVVGGRRSLPSPAQYEVRASEGGEGVHIRLLSNADAIVTPLAALTSVQGVAPAAAPDVNAVGAEAVGSAAPAPAPAEPAAVPAPPRETARPRERPQSRAPAAASPRARAEAAKGRPEREPERQAAATPPRRPPAPAKATAATPRPPAKAAAAPPPVQQAADVRPSFDCRRARARSEKAVCGDAGLASLDRRMSGQYFSALRSARPGQRALLQRSRNRFIAYRNSCATQSCIAQAYRDRIREIDTIMTGGY